jgi:hypothetical protein
MKTRLMVGIVVLLTAFGFAAHPASAAAVQSEVPQGTRFLVELRDTLKAEKVKRGKKFDARTLEALPTADGRILPAGAKLKGKVSYADDNELMLRFEEIEFGGQKQPIVASVLGVVGEKGVKSTVGKEGEIEGKGGSRGKRAAIGAAVGGGIGTVVGVTKGDKKDAAIAGGSGAALGALIGAASGGRELVLDKGTRIQLQLDRPLWLTSKN